MRLLSLAFLLAAACSGDAPSYETLGDATAAVGEAFCDRAIECGAFTPDERQLCEVEFLDVVCGTLECGDAFNGLDEDIDLCARVLDTAPCGADDLPTQCQGVLR